jgi:hypothetical protein
MVGDPQVLEPLVIRSCGWKFSAIDGDPTLGPGIKCYATKHFKASLSEREVLLLLNIAASTLEAQGAKVVRRKIELVIYDDRSSKIRIGE